MHTPSYRLAPLYGLYFYLLFHLIYLFRFGRINTDVQPLDITILLVGIASVVLYIFFAKKLEQRRNLLLIPFLVALPFALFGALIGGVSGAAGILIFGLLPFIIALPIGYRLIAKFTGTSTATPSTSS